jgi:AcrR family transcriptional regulator
MPPKHQTEQERQEIRIRFIDAARELFVARGVEAVTMREVAKRTAYSPTALYLHFADKEALLRAVCDTDFLALAQSFRDVIDISDPIERLSVLGESYALFALAHPNHYRLMFMTPRPCCDPQNSAIQQGNLQQDAYAQLKEMVRLAFVADCFRDELDDPEIIAQTIWAGIHGVCSLQIALGNDAWVDWRTAENRVSLMRDVLIRGLVKVS